MVLLIHRWLTVACFPKTCLKNLFRSLNEECDKGNARRCFRKLVLILKLGNFSNCRIFICYLHVRRYVLTQKNGNPIWNLLDILKSKYIQWLVFWKLFSSWNEECVFDKGKRIFIFRLGICMLIIDKPLSD